MPERTKRLDLRLPTDHPIWKYPKGTRGVIAREWLNFGYKFSQIEERLSQIEKRLENTPIKHSVNNQNVDQSTTVDTKKLRTKVMNMLGGD
ncbi:MAG: hypothetical protein PHT79_09765 [Syntrophomonadaceae bacterium]|nr:hypothetical protein [Syntrophomonadaceae bacterium]MDD4550028.1 hypothetical protein [Syntrophomonadaceae bacterium]